MHATRISMVLGASLHDDTDQRIAVNSRCYELIDAVAPRPALDDEATQRTLVERRVKLYRICNKRVANQQRLALRFAGRLISFTDAAGVNQTQLELFAGGAVWAPFSYFTLSPYFRRFFNPTPSYELGLALSVGGNVGGAGDATKSWARVAIDVILVFQKQLIVQPLTPEGVRPPDTDQGKFMVRVLPSVAFPLLGDAVVTLATGPLLGFAMKQPVESGALVNAGLSYDIDRLAAALLSR